MKRLCLFAASFFGLVNLASAVPSPLYCQSADRKPAYKNLSVFLIARDGDKVKMIGLNKDNTPSEHAWSYFVVKEAPPAAFRAMRAVGDSLDSVLGGEMFAFDDGKKINVIVTYINAPTPEFGGMILECRG